MNGMADDNVPLLSCGVVGIIVDPRKRVLKHSCGLFERDAVSEEIGPGLRRVPLEYRSSHRGDVTAAARVSGSVR